MHRFLLAPRWLAWHVALVVVLVAFTLLGRWQLHVYEDADRREQQNASTAPVPLDEVSSPGGRLTGRTVGARVTARGSYDGEHQLLVPGRRIGGRDGFLLVTPLRTTRGVLPVTRGWVPSPSDPAATAPTGPVTVTGVVQPSESEQDSGVDPLAPLPAGQIPYVATVRLLTALPYPESALYDGYVVLTAQAPAPDPAPRLVEPRGLDQGIGRWRNLAYALQWWLFGAAAIFFWWSVVRRAARERRGEPVAAGQP